MTTSVSIYIEYFPYISLHTSLLAFINEVVLNNKVEALNKMRNSSIFVEGEIAFVSEHEFCQSCLLLSL